VLPPAHHRRSASGTPCRGRRDTGAVRHAGSRPTGAGLVELIPSNPVRAAVDGNLLPLIVFITIFAVAAAALPERSVTPLPTGRRGTQALIRIVRWVLLLAPIGIFAIVASALSQFGRQVYRRSHQSGGRVHRCRDRGLAALIAVVLLPVVALVGGSGRDAICGRSAPLCSWRSRPLRRSPPFPSCSKPRRATCGSRARCELRAARGASVGRVGSALFQRWR